MEVVAVRLSGFVFDPTGVRFRFNWAAEPASLQKQLFPAVDKQL